MQGMPAHGHEAVMVEDVVRRVSEKEEGGVGESG